MTSVAALKKLNAELNKRIGLSELLGYAAIIDKRTVILKDGSLQAIYQFYGDDMASVPAAMQTGLASRWSEAVTRFGGENLIIEMDMIRRDVNIPAQQCDFPDAVSALIDQERRWQFEQGGQLFETQTVVTFTWHPPRELSTRTKKFMFNSDNALQPKRPEEICQDFETKLEQFITYVAFGRTQKFVRLTQDHLVSFLYDCLTGTGKSLACPDQSVFLDTYLARDAFIGGFEPQVGEQHVRLLAFDSYPASIHAMYLHVLNQLAIPFRYHTRFIILDREQARRQLKRQRRNWSNKAIGMMGIIREAFGSVVIPERSASERAEECDQAISENESGELVYGLFNGVFVFHDANVATLNRRVQDVKRAVEQLSFSLREETINASDAFLGSLPGHGNYNVRRNLFDSLSWSMAIPLSSIYAGQRVCPSPLYPAQSPALLMARTEESNIYWFSNLVSDVGHTLILGPTGAGKTTLLDLMLSQHRRYPNSRQIVLSKDDANRMAILAHGGHFVDASTLRTAAIAPFSQLHEPKGFEMARKWLQDLLVLNGCEMTPHRREALHQALTDLARQAPVHRTFHHLSIQDHLMRKTLQELNTGMFAVLMNGTDDRLFEQTLFGLNVGSILDLRKGLPESILQAILDKFEWHFRDGTPTLLMLDEAWMFLDHPILQARLKAWLKTLRKYNVSVVFASQSITDVSQSAICDVIIESCPTQIFLPNHQATQPHVETHYTRFGLNPREIALLAHATPKRQYYIVQPQGRRLVDLTLGEVALRFLGLSRHAAKRFDRCYDADDPHWIGAYLKHCGLNEVATFVETHLKRMDEKEKSDVNG